MLQKIRNFLSVGNRASFAVFCLFSLTIFLKVTLFHWFCFQSFQLPYSQGTILDALVFWVPKVAISLFVASFIFISQSKWWTVILLLFLDIWIIANLIYFRANGLFINIGAMRMIGNLDGFYTSILSYWNWKSTIFLFTTALYVILTLPIKIGNTTIKTYLWVLFAIMLIEAPVGLERFVVISKSTDLYNYNWHKKVLKYIIPYGNTLRGVRNYVIWNGQNIDSSKMDERYIIEHSIIAYVPYMGVLQSAKEYELNKYNYAKRSFLSTDCINPEELNKFFNDGIVCPDDMRANAKPSYNLFLILVESYESWTLDLAVEDDKSITPHLNNFIKNQHVAYFSKIKSQAKEGVSGDGQMICNTGLLPLPSGAACVLYGENVFPNWAHYFPNSTIIIPTPAHTWNQNTVTHSYGYSALISSENSTIREDDNGIVNLFISEIDTIPHNIPICYQLLTISMHTPFRGHNNNLLKYTSDIPIVLKNYLNCVHYADSCLGNFIDYFLQSEYADNTTLVITGDHTIFKDMMLREFKPYAEAHNLPIKDGKNYVPLIIYSPEIKKNIKVDEECYQMDIYPTIMHLIGCEDYYWKGFGVNLLDSAARHNRPCTEEEAYQLSDKLIRSNYFATHSNQE